MWAGGARPKFLPVPRARSGCHRLKWGYRQRRIGTHLLATASSAFRLLHINNVSLTFFLPSFLSFGVFFFIVVHWTWTAHKLIPLPLPWMSVSFPLFCNGARSSKCWGFLCCRRHIPSNHFRIWMSIQCEFCGASSECAVCVCEQWVYLQ